MVAHRKGESPWHLLTSEPAHSSELAWKIVFAYARRWQIEMALRYNKSEFAFEKRLCWYCCWSIWCYWNVQFLNQDRFDIDFDSLHPCLLLDFKSTVTLTDIAPSST